MWAFQVFAKSDAVHSASVFPSCTMWKTRIGALYIGVKSDRMFVLEMI